MYKPSLWCFSTNQFWTLAVFLRADCRFDRSPKQNQSFLCVSHFVVHTVPNKTSLHFLAKPPRTRRKNPNVQTRKTTRTLHKTCSVSLRFPRTDFTALNVQTIQAIPNWIHNAVSGPLEQCVGAAQKPRKVQTEGKPKTSLKINLQPRKRHSLNWMKNQLSNGTNHLGSKNPTLTPLTTSLLPHL